MSDLFKLLNIEQKKEKEIILEPKTEQNAYAKIIFRFDTKEDFEEFSKLVNQRIKAPEDNIWFPEKVFNPNKVKVIGDINIKQVTSIFDLMKK